MYARLREQAPVHFDGASYTVSSYEQVAALLKDERLCVDYRKVGARRDPRADNPVTRRPPDMMNLDNPEHARLRSLINSAFTPSSVRAFRPRIEETAMDLASSLSSSCDVISEYAAPLTTIVIAEYIGADADRHRDFKAWTNALLMQGYPMPTPELREGIVAAENYRSRPQSHPGIH